MELVPEDVIGQEFLRYFTPNELITYCATTKKNARICRSRGFWKLKILSTPRRELQNEWFLFLAKKGETGLLSKLYDAITTEGIILDNRAICYAALYLLEKENELSASGHALLDLLTARAEEDKYLIQQLKDAELNSLSDFFENIRSNIIEFKLLVNKGLIKYGKIAIYQTGVGLENLYLGEYQQDYFYKQTLHILPHLIKDIEIGIRLKASSGDFIRYTGAFIRAIIRNEGIARVKDIWRHIDKSDNPNAEPPFYDRLLFSRVLSEATYKEARKIDDSEFLWVCVIAAIPVDPAIFFELVKLENYSIYSSVLTNGYRALQPEEYIQYLNNLVAEAHITVDFMIYTMQHVVGKAESAGYTYLSLIFREEIERLKVNYK